MGNLDLFGITGVSSGSYGAPAPTRLPSAPPLASGPSTFTRNPPESFSLPNLVGELGQTPARVYETPVSIANQLTGGGVSMFGRGLPVLPQAAGFADEALKREGNFIPSLINANDADVWRAVGNLPNSTVITRELLQAHGATSGFFGSGEQTGGIPILSTVLSALGLGSGPFSRDKTVGELRDELAQRGFFTDDKGTPSDPALLAADLQSGKRSPFDFGYAAINDNSMVDLLGRLGTDPVNLAFIAAGPLGWGAKGAMLLGKIGLVEKLTAAGLIGTKMASAAVQGERLLLEVDRVSKAAQAMGALRASTLGRGLSAIGRAAEAPQAFNLANIGGLTLKGVAYALRHPLASYRNTAIASWGATVAGGRLAGLANDLTGGSIPLLQGVEDFTTAIENDKPLSRNAAFILLAAGTFPYRAAFVAPTKKLVGKVVQRTIGYGDLDEFYRMYGGKAKAEELHGGPQAVATKLDLIDSIYIADRDGLLPGYMVAARSLPEMAYRRARDLEALRPLVDEARTRGEITGAIRAEVDRQWAEESGGVKFEKVRGVAKTGEIRGVTPFDPVRHATQWREFYTNQRKVLQPVLDATGEVTSWIRHEPTTRVYEDALKYARDNSILEDGMRTVPVDKVLDMVVRHPAIGIADTKGYFARFSRGDLVNPTLLSVEAKLRAGRAKALNPDELFAPIANLERAAPKDIAQSFAEYHALKDPRAEVDAVRAEVVASGGGVPTDAPTLRRIASLRRLAADPAATPNEAIVSGLKADLLENGKLTPELQARLDAAQANLKILRDAQDAKRAVGTGLTREQLQAIEDHAARFSTGLDAAPFLDTSIKHVDPVEATMLGLLEREMHDTMPSYQLGGLPATEFLKDVPPNLQVPIRMRTMLGEHLFQAGWFSPIGKFFHDITRPISGTELAIARRRALENHLMPLGWTPSEVRLFLTELQDEAAGHSGTVGPLELKLFRDEGALLPRKVNQIADGIIEREASAPRRARLRAALAANGDAYHALWKASSAYHRSLTTKAAASALLRRRSLDADGRFELLQKRANIARSAIAQVKDRRAIRNRTAKALEAEKLMEDARQAADDAYLVAEKSRSRVAMKQLDIANGFMEGTGVRGKVGDAGRIIGRLIYPNFRFNSSPRWITMNYTEGGIIGASKFGTFKRYADSSEASLAAQHFSDKMFGKLGKSAKREVDPTTGQVAGGYDTDIGRTSSREGMALHAVKSFDHAGYAMREKLIADLERQGQKMAAIRERAAMGDFIDAETRKMLDSWGDIDIHLRTLRSGLQSEGLTLRAEADRALAAGEINAAEHASMVGRAKQLSEASTRTLSDHLEQQMYRYTQDGTVRTIKDEIAKQLSDEEILRMAPLLERIHAANHALWRDVRQVFYGNPTRSGLERVTNSYWLYWPISYQIKATKWLAEVMLDGSFGMNNNALLAGVYANWVNQHNEQLKLNSAYAALYEANQTLWYAAQMLLPISPDSMGVSLSRFTRMLGSQTEDWLNSYFGTDYNVFNTDALLSDTARSLQSLTELGPVYDVNLFSRIEHDLATNGGGSSVPGKPIVPGQPLP